VYGYSFVAGAAATAVNDVYFTDGTTKLGYGGTTHKARLDLTSVGGIQGLSHTPGTKACMITGSGLPFNIDLSAAQPVVGWVSYELEKAAS